MEVIGIGTDIVKVSRMEKVLEKDTMMKKIFSAKEIEIIKTKKNPWEFMAGRFAVKESIIKVLHSENYEIFSSISVLNHENGAPYLELSPELKKICESKGIEDFMVTLSHEKEYAVATVIGGK